MTETKKKRLQMNNSMGGMKMWWAIMAVYILLFGYIGYIAFWPMDFNDPNNTVKKYLTILEEYQSKTKTNVTEVTEPTEATDATDATDATKDAKIFQLAIEELMKKAEDSASDTQKLASQSFNIVLGAFLAFLSATVAMLFQKSTKKEEPEPEETG